MINEILLYIIYGLIIVSLIIYILLIFVNRNKNISNLCGFDAVDSMLQEYDRINIIQGNSKFSFYNIKRKVIKLSKRDYYGSDISSISLSMIQAGISVVDNGKNKFINICKSIVSTLKIIDLFWILILFINYISVTISDAKIGIVLVGIIMIIHYLYIGVLDNSLGFINDKIKKIKEIKNRGMIINFVNRVILCNKIMFIAEVVLIIRMVAIILGM